MPLGELRRQDRAMGRAESGELLERALVGRIGTVSENAVPYVVPMNFVYDPSSSAIFVHCAISGHLLENLAVNPRICVEVDEPGEIIAAGDDACDTSQVYKSVICFGTARIVADAEEKVQILRLFALKYIDRVMPDRKYEIDFRTIDTTVAIAINVERMTGKTRSAS
jgi:nitroimidazol reductase NimA-like FMN-containing flavoprotein (pyridoxamine 5'-phosphate oxidase superfamily)